MRTKFEPILLYRTPCNNCGKLIKDHFDGYCERQEFEITSPLSDDELTKVWGKAHEYSDHYERRRAIANAAKRATIREVAAMAFDTSLLECNDGWYSAAAMRLFAGACVAEFQKKLLAGIGETK